MATDIKLVRCFNQDCQREIGRLIDNDGVSFLQVGGVLLREAHGVCIHCGYRFHWSVRDLMFERLIGRAINNQNMQ